MDWPTATGTGEPTVVSSGNLHPDDNGHWKGGRRPHARDDKAETDEETLVSIDLLANDRHAARIFKIDGEYVRPGDTVTLDSGAKVTLTSDGDITYDPTSSDEFDLLNDGEQALDSFTYWVFGGKGFDSATVHVAVDGVTDDPGGNQPPVANHDLIGVPYGPFPYPYPKPIPLPLAESGSSSPAMAPETQLTPVEGPIVTTLAIGEEGDPDPLPDSVDIFPLRNDVDPDGDAMTIGTINGEMVKPGDVVTLHSGATLEVSADGTYLTYSGGFLDGEFSALVATEEAIALTETGGGEAILYPTELSEPLSLSLAPNAGDVFTYQAFDGVYLSNEASVLLVRELGFDVLASDVLIV